MFVPIVLLGTYKLCSAVAFYLRVYAPTNITLGYLRSPQGLKWAIPAALALTSAYWGAGYVVTTLVENGGPGWLNLVTALYAWNGIKFAMLGLWSPILMAAAVLRRPNAEGQVAQASELQRVAIPHRPRGLRQSGQEVRNGPKK